MRESSLQAGCCSPMAQLRCLCSHTSAELATWKGSRVWAADRYLKISVDTDLGSFVICDRSYFGSLAESVLLRKRAWCTCCSSVPLSPHVTCERAGHVHLHLTEGWKSQGREVFVEQEGSRKAEQSWRKPTGSTSSGNGLLKCCSLRSNSWTCLPLLALLLVNMETGCSWCTFIHWVQPWGNISVPRPADSTLLLPPLLVGDGWRVLIPGWLIKEWQLAWNIILLLQELWVT